MTVIQKSVVSGEQLLKLVPDNVYVKSAPYTQRVITRINSTNQSGVSTTFPSSTILQYTINPTDNNLINLDECYFTIAGELRFYDENDAELSNDLPADIIHNLILPPYWYINSFLTLNLYISGTLVRTINNPMMLVNFYTSHYKSFTDRQNGNLEERGIYPIPSVNYDYIDANDNNKIKLKNDTKYILSSYTDLSGASQTTPYPYNIQFYKNKDGIDFATFQLDVYLNDLFPEVSTIKPLYGQSCMIEIKLESDGYTSIRGTDVSDISYAKIKRFSQFNFNVVSYTLDSQMKEKLKQIYSKEIISIIDDISYYPSSLQNTGKDSQFTLSIPLNIAFQSSLVNISWPQATGNNYKIYTDWDNTYLYLNHTKFDNRLFPLRSIVVQCDGCILYQREYSTTTIELDSTYLLDSNPLIKSLTNAHSNGGFNLYDYTLLYKEYKESRYCTDENEHNAIPIDEWLNNYFSVNIPTSAFTTLNTQQNIILLLNFGTFDNSQQYDITRFTTSTTAGEYINQIKVIQKSSKALVFKAYNQAEIRTITQSFSNDITIDNLNENQINQ